MPPATKELKAEMRRRFGSHQRDGAIKALETAGYTRTRDNDWWKPGIRTVGDMTRADFECLLYLNQQEGFGGLVQPPRPRFDDDDPLPAPSPPPPPEEGSRLGAVRLVILGGREHPENRDGDDLWRALDYLLAKRPLALVICRDASAEPDAAALTWCREHGVTCVFVHDDWRDGNLLPKGQVERIMRMKPDACLSWRQAGADSQADLLLVDALLGAKVPLWVPPASAIDPPPRVAAGGQSHAPQSGA